MSYLYTYFELARGQCWRSLLYQFAHTRMHVEHVDDVSGHTYIHTYISTAIFSYEWFMWGSLRLTPIKYKLKTHHPQAYWRSSQVHCIMTLGNAWSFAAWISKQFSSEVVMVCWIRCHVQMWARLVWKARHFYVFWGTCVNVSAYVCMYTCLCICGAGGRGLIDKYGIE